MREAIIEVVGARLKKRWGQDLQMGQEEEGARPVKAEAAGGVSPPRRGEQSQLRREVEMPGNLKV